MNVLNLKHLSVGSRLGVPEELHPFSKVRDQAKNIFCRECFKQQRRT